MNDSRDLKNEEMEEMLETMEQMQEQIENRDQMIQKEREEKSKILSENSLLRNEIQKKSETIVSLNEKIEKLNESDLVLEKAQKQMNDAEIKMKETERLLQEKDKECQEKIKTIESKCEQELSKRQSEVEDVRRYYWKKEDELDEKSKELDKRSSEILEKEIRVNAKEICVNDVVNSKAAKMVSETQKNIKDKYKKKYIEQETFYYTVLLYGVLITLFNGINSITMRNDVIDAFKWIRRSVITIWKFAIKAGKFIGSLGGFIPIKLVAMLIHHILFAIVFLIIIALPVFIVGYGIYKLSEAYYYDCWDIISIAVLLVNIAVLTSFGTVIRPVIHINLVLVLVVVQILYVVVRSYFFR